MSDIGYDHLFTGPNAKRSKEERAEIVEELRQKRHLGDIPPVYPNGWYALLNSDEVAIGEVQYVAALGK